MNPFEPKPFKAEGPIPLIREVAPSEPFPVEALGPLTRAVEAIASITEAPPALCAGSVLAASALAVQGLSDVQTLGGPRPASLFILTVAESGERKSTADRLAMRGVRRFEASLNSEFEMARKNHKIKQAIWEKRKVAILRGPKSDYIATEADLLALGPEPEPPLKPHIVTGSATVEGIVKHLPELRASLGIMSDEGGLMLGGHGMKAENRLNTLATLAAMWDGSTLDRWRAGDGVAAHAGRRFSAHWMVQPSAAVGLLSDPLANGQGLLARFLTCHPTSHIGTRLRLGQDAQAEAEVDRLAARIEKLLARPLALAERRRNELSPPLLPLSPEAHSVLTFFAREVEKAQAPGGSFEEARAFASKAAEHAARLAGVMTIFADPEALTVTGETMADAVKLATFYSNEAARLHAAAVTPPHVQDAERMRQWLLGSWKEDYISAAVATQRGPFKQTDRSRKALSLLETHGYVVSAPGAEVDGKTRREAWKIVRGV